MTKLTDDNSCILCTILNNGMFAIRMVCLNRSTWEENKEEKTRFNTNHSLTNCLICKDRCQGYKFQNKQTELSCFSEFD